VGAITPGVSAPSSSTNTHNIEKIVMEKEQDNTAILVVAERLSSLHEDVNDLRNSMKESMRDISSALSKLVQMEERQIQVRAEAGRATMVSEESLRLTRANETSIAEIKRDMEFVGWLKKGVYTVAALVAGIVLFKAGIYIP
jgi:hypothetical protein